MTTQFEDQGGAAASDPSRVVRWLTSRLMTRFSRPERSIKQRASAERQRRKAGLPHRVEYFHQVDDGYSHLAGQVLERFRERYDVELVCHLVNAPSGRNAAEPEMLSRLSRYDARQIAPGYGLDFPEHTGPPIEELLCKARGILAAHPPADRVALVEPTSRALWRGDHEAMDALVADHGRATDAATASAFAAGDTRRASLHHYSGAMFYYGGEWYWGADRFYLLEQRLAALGADRESDRDPIASRPAIELPQRRDNKAFTLEFYASLRSPYTAVVFDRAVAFARDAGVTLALRPVLPMVMRGVPATREKGMYIFMDAAREARSAGVAYGNFYDPIGNPVRNCYALYPWAASQGKEVELLSSFLRHAFVLGVNTNTEGGLRKVVEAAGLDWIAAQAHRQDTAWEALLEENRLAMYRSGLWGVPSFRLLDSTGQAVLAVWGQDRLWLLAKKLCELVNEASPVS